jgi:hypothetical protein
MEQNGGFNYNIKKIQNKITKTSKEIEKIKIKLEK